MKKVIGTCLVCLVTAATGCGGGGGSATVSDFCKSYTDSVKSLIVQCLGAPQDAVDAIFASQNANMCTNMDQAVASKRATYDSTKGAACLSELSGAACSDLATFGGPSDPCTLAVVGAVAAGGSCYTDTDCAGGFCNGVSGTNCPATCAAYAAVGADCSQGQTCANGSSCDGQTCVAPATQGQPCGGSGNYCAANLYCDGLNGAAGICQPAKASGQSCAGAGECQFGLACIGGTCASIKKVGETCSSTTDCGLYTWCKSGTCTEYPGVGGACGMLNSQDYVDCVGGYCNITNQTSYTGTCAAYLSIGATCNPNDYGACGSAECDNSKCTAACMEK